MTMYHPPTFMTMDVLTEVLGEFDWPEPPTLEDDLPDGIVVHLRRCSLYFVEGFESDMDVHFLPGGSGPSRMMPVGEAIARLRADPHRVLPPTPALTSHPIDRPSLAKVQNGLRDLCALLFAFFTPALLGEFDWPG